VQVKIWVNDVPLINWTGVQTKDGVYNGEVPINQVILENGTFQLECKLVPRHGNKVLGQSKSPDIYTKGNVFDSEFNAKKNYNLS